MKILTKREQEIFELLLAYDSCKDIALKLSLSEKTIRNHISNVIIKLGVKDRTQAIIELLRLNEIQL